MVAPVLPRLTYRERLGDDEFGELEIRQPALSQRWTSSRGPGANEDFVRIVHLFAKPLAVFQREGAYHNVS